MHAISRTSSRLIGGFEKCVAPVEDDSRDRVNDSFFPVCKDSSIRPLPWRVLRKNGTIGRNLDKRPVSKPLSPTRSFAVRGSS